MNTGTIEDRYNAAVNETESVDGIAFKNSITAAFLKKMEDRKVEVAYHSVDGAPLSWASGKPKITTEEGSVSISRIDIFFRNGADAIVARAFRKQDFIVDDSEEGILKVALV